MVIQNTENVEKERAIRCLERGQCESRKSRRLRASVSGRNTDEKCTGAERQYNTGSPAPSGGPKYPGPALWRPAPRRPEPRCTRNKQPTALYTRPRAFLQYFSMYGAGSTRTKKRVGSRWIPARKCVWRSKLKNKTPPVGNKNLGTQTSQRDGLREADGRSKIGGLNFSLITAADELIKRGLSLFTARYLHFLRFKRVSPHLSCDTGKRSADGVFFFQMFSKNKFKYENVNLLLVYRWAR